MHSRSLRRAAWLAACLLGPTAAGAEERPVLLATTTSVQDSGLLSELLPEFEKRTGIRVQVIAVGSGAALRMGADGNADLLLTHAPAGEEELVASGAVVSRTPFMENHFVLVGPPEDPVHVRDAASAEEAYRRLAAAPAPYVSRGDDSGTHRREVELLTVAGLDPKGGWSGFASTGAGMGLTLQVAGEKRAYALSDLGTHLAFRERTRLVVVSKRFPGLRNEYSLLPVNPERFPRVNAAGALELQAFFLEAPVQERIARFGRERFGEPLFQPLRLATPAPPAPAPGPR
jgi:tungstate transport system substrate-binding protein